MNSAALDRGRCDEGRHHGICTGLTACLLSGPLPMTHTTIVLTNFRNAPAIVAQPRMALYQWRVVALDGVEILVGFLENGYTCRVATGIASISLPSREIQTQSGRLYELIGPPASDPVSLMVIAGRLAMLRSATSTDVTEGIWAAMCAATA